MLRPKSVRVVCAFAQSEVARNSVPKRCGVNLASFQGKQNVEHVECRKERSHMVYADSETDNNREKKVRKDWRQRKQLAGLTAKRLGLQVGSGRFFAESFFHVRRRNTSRPNPQLKIIFELVVGNLRACTLERSHAFTKLDIEKPTF